MVLGSEENVPGITGRQDILYLPLLLHDEKLGFNYKIIFTSSKLLVLSASIPPSEYFSISKYLNTHTHTLLVLCVCVCIYKQTNKPIMV